MSDMGSQLVANVFKALSHPTRLQILQLLKNGPLCVCEILPAIESEQSNTSQHLSILKAQSIVESRKEGAKVIYSVSNGEVYDMISIAENMIFKQIEETRLSMKNKLFQK